MPNGSIVQVAKRFVGHILLCHDVVRVLVSNHVINFIPKPLAELLGQRAITDQKTSAYDPETNGIEKRFKRTISEMLYMYVSSNHSNWCIDPCSLLVTVVYNS